MIGFYIFLIFKFFLMILPENLRKKLFIGLGFLAYKLSRRYKKVVIQNVKFVYGNDVKEDFIDEIARYSFRLMLINLFYVIEMRNLSIKKIKKQITFVNEEVIQKAKNEKKPIIFITSHYGAWELGGGMISAFLEPLMIVYKSMNNSYFEQYLLSSRDRYNIEYVKKQGATKGLIKRLQSGGSVALLIDTNIEEKDGIKVDFLGHKTSQLKSVAYLAKKFNAAVIPVLIHEDKDSKYTIEFYDEIIPSPDKEYIKESTRLQSEWLSKEILKSPKPWFWLHRRWKNNYPEIYNT